VSAGRVAEDPGGVKASRSLEMADARKLLSTEYWKIAVEMKEKEC
jgi:hypothetical protein